MRVMYTNVDVEVPAAANEKFVNLISCGCAGARLIYTSIQRDIRGCILRTSSLTRPPDLTFDNIKPLKLGHPTSFPSREALLGPGGRRAVLACP